MSKLDLSPFSASELARMTRNREISPLETTRFFIDKIESVNPYLNAVTERFFESAMFLAKNQTEFLMQAKSKELPWLFGVPLTIKEMFALKGARRTAGNIHHQEDVMNFDSSLVARLKQAGAIPLCTTNVPELGLWYETNNVIYGRTKNPYDPSRTPGGSSGGESALIGAGASPLGLGSDIGGSLRIPAAFCGIFGHKPTWRYLPKTGHFPNTLETMPLENESTYSITTMGFMSQKSEDLRPLLELLSGPDGYDPMITKKWSPHFFVKEMKKMKVYSLTNPNFQGATSVSTELQEICEQAIDCFVSQGAEHRPLDSDIFFKALFLWAQATEGGSTQSFRHKMAGSRKFNLWNQFLRSLVGQADYTFPALVACLLEKINTTSRSENLDQEFKKVENVLKEIFDGQSVLISPVHPRVAPRHNWPFLFPFDFIYTGIFNAFGLPATSVPMGLNSQGLPLSVQITSGLGQDALNFWFAEILEKEFGGWVAPQLSGRNTI